MDYTARFGLEFNPFLKNSKEILVETQEFLELRFRLDYLLSTKGFGLLTGSPGQGKTTALFQGYGASAATLAVSACTVIQSEPGALLCYHNPSGAAEGDYQEMRRSAEALRNARDCILEMYTARRASKSREELISLMDKNIWITPTQAKEYGHGKRRELVYLTVHSVLHLLGYDHLDEGPQKAQMRAREEASMALLGLGRP